MTAQPASTASAASLPLDQAAVRAWYPTAIAACQDSAVIEQAIARLRAPGAWRAEEVFVAAAARATSQRTREALARRPVVSCAVAEPQWEPLLVDGPLADRARDAIRAIGDALATREIAAGDAAGVALFYMGLRRYESGNLMEMRG